MNDGEIIWTPNGCFLQTVIDGVSRISDFGKQPLEDVVAHCKKTGIKITVIRSDWGRPARPTQRSEEQSGAKR